MCARFLGGWFLLAGLILLGLNFGFGPGHWSTLLAFGVVGCGVWMAARRLSWKGVRDGRQ